MTSGDDLPGADLLCARESAQNFAVAGELLDIERVDTGHINVTYRSRWTKAGGSRAKPIVQQYIHQRMNSEVFKDVPAILRNVQLITDHLRPRVLAPELTLEFVCSRTGKLWHEDSSGALWRTFGFIEDSEGFDVSPSDAHAEAVGAAFGRFLRLLHDFDQTLLVEPIKGFQDVQGRYTAFESALQQDPEGRAVQAAELVSFVQEHRHLASLIAEGINSGAVPTRVTHADPKVNNVLFRRGSPQVLCVVDLDTCMVGTSLYDFGDMVRSAGVPVEEDEQDLSKVKVDLRLFAALARGYLAECGTILTPAESALMAQAPGVIAFSLGMRFLSDFILGDRYFRVHYPTHNLVRAKAQLQIARWVVQNQGSLEQVLKESLP